MDASKTDQSADASAPAPSPTKVKDPKAKPLSNLAKRRIRSAALMEEYLAERRLKAADREAEEKQAATVTEEEDVDNYNDDDDDDYDGDDDDIEQDDEEDNDASTAGADMTVGGKAASPRLGAVDEPCKSMIVRERSQSSYLFVTPDPDWETDYSTTAVSKAEADIRHRVTQASDVAHPHIDLGNVYMALTREEKIEMLEKEQQALIRIREEHLEEELAQIRLLRDLQRAEKYLVETHDAGAIEDAKDIDRLFVMALRKRMLAEQSLAEKVELGKVLMQEQADTEEQVQLRKEDLQRE